MKRPDLDAIEKRARDAGASSSWAVKVVRPNGGIPHYSLCHIGDLDPLDGDELARWRFLAACGSDVLELVRYSRKLEQALKDAVNAINENQSWSAQMLSQTMRIVGDMRAAEAEKEVERLKAELESMRHRIQHDPVGGPAAWWE